jgi:hypothetical protein
MIIMHPNGRVVPAPITIDVAKLLASSALAGNKVFGPLPPAATNAIDQTVAAQKDAKRKGSFMPTNQVISGPGYRVARRNSDIRLPRDDHDNENGTFPPNGQFPPTFPGGPTGNP